MSLAEKQKPGVAHHSGHPAERQNLPAKDYVSRTPFTSQNVRDERGCP